MQINESAGPTRGPPPPVVSTVDDVSPSRSGRAFLALLAATMPARADTCQVTGRVVAAHNGDTDMLLDANKRPHKVRVDGIDAPELGQALGRAPKRTLSDLAIHRSVVADCHKTDRYGREVCGVSAGGMDVALAQIERGMAWVFTRYEANLAVERRQ